MNYTKEFLDEKIILYKKEMSSNFINKILNLESLVSEENIWSISSIGNIKNTDHTNKNKVINLPDGDCFLVKQDNNLLNSQLYLIKNEIIKHSFECILDYIKYFELNIKKLKEWKVVEEKESISSHYDQDRDGNKHNYTVIVSLNNSYSGGQLYFQDRIGNDPVSLGIGDILIYPSNENYAHYQLPVISGSKYIAISYF